MRHSISIAALVVTLVAASAVARADGAALEKLSTHLYYHQTGVVDDREASGLALWNTIIGEGDAQGPSSATVVRVTVTGAQTLQKGAVEVVVTAGKKKVLKQRVSLDGYSVDAGKPVVVPFVVYDTGCDSLAVSATLYHGRKSIGAKKAVVPFSCGE
jgi:hypothetical protein